MKQIRYSSSPAMVSSWSVTTIGKILFLLTVAVYALSEAQGLAAAAENRSEQLTFSGRAVDNNGVPVADAEVRYAVSFYPLEGGASSEHSSHYDPDFFTRTGIEGTFRFELVPSKFAWMPFDAKDMLNRLNIAVTHPITQSGGKSFRSKAQQMLKFNSKYRGLFLVK